MNKKRKNKILNILLRKQAAQKQAAEREKRRAEVAKRIAAQEAARKKRQQAQLEKQHADSSRPTSETSAYVPYSQNGNLDDSGESKLIL